jgi:RHS repeat-associated protein
MKLARVALPLAAASVVAVPLYAQPPGLKHYKDPLLDPDVQRIMREASRRPARPARWISGPLPRHVCSERRVDEHGRLLRDKRVLPDGTIEETEYKPAGVRFRVVLHGPRGTLEAARFCGAGCGSRAGAQVVANGWPTPWAHEALMAGERERQASRVPSARRTTAAFRPAVAPPRAAAPRPAGASKTLTYDANGNLVADTEGNQYRYDYEDRLTRVTKPDGSVIEHAYDADGNRVRTVVTPATGPPQVTDFLVDPSGGLSHVVAESDETGALKAHYVRGDDLLAVMRPITPVPAVPADWLTRYYHADGVGSVRRLTDEAGLVSDSYTYTAFGERIAHTGTDPQPYAFAGEPWDPNSGFQYHRARWMDPNVGRFVSMDPFGGRAEDPASLHRYLYGGANPVDRVDPSGLDWNLPSVSLAAANISIIAAVSLPRFHAALLTIGNILSPVELGLPAPRVSVWQLRGAVARGGPAVLEHLGSIRRAWIELNRRATGPLGLEFEEWISHFLSKNVRRQVRVLDGLELGSGPGSGSGAGGAKLDYVDDALELIVEVKSSFSTVSYNQALQAAQYAALHDKRLVYVFLRKPTNQQLKDLMEWVADGVTAANKTDIDVRFTTVF